MFLYAETLYELASQRQRELIAEAERQRLLRSARKDRSEGRSSDRSNNRRERARATSTLAACGSQGTAPAR